MSVSVNRADTFTWKLKLAGLTSKHFELRRKAVAYNWRTTDQEFQEMRKNTKPGSKYCFRLHWDCDERDFSSDARFRLKSGRATSRLTVTRCDTQKAVICGIVLVTTWPQSCNPDDMAYCNYSSGLSLVTRSRVNVLSPLLTLRSSRQRTSKRTYVENLSARISSNIQLKEFTRNA